MAWCILMFSSITMSSGWLWGMEQLPELGEKGARPKQDDSNREEFDITDCDNKLSLINCGKGKFGKNDIVASQRTAHAQLGVDSQFLFFLISKS